MINRIGQRLGNYRLLRLLGQGGFSEVYLGEHVFLGTQAAIKVLSVRLVAEEMEAFQNEARTIAGLRHPNILRVLEFGLEDTIPFLVMEYATNGSLRQQHPRGVLLPAHLVLSYVKQVASALQYVHHQKLIHRDIKPENLLLGPTGDVLLSDFGTALVIQTLHNPVTREMAGTLTYMAPEQLRGKALPASDQYSLGIMVYEWLCGRPPFEGTFIQLSGQHLFTSPPPMSTWVPGIPSDVELVVMTSLAKEPERRFANVTAFAHALEQAIMPPQSLASSQPGFTLPANPAPALWPAPFHSTQPEEQAPTLPTPVFTPANTPRSVPAYEQMPTARFTPAFPETVSTTPPAPARESFPGEPITPPLGTSSPKPQRRHSRRAVLVGILGLGCVLAGGGVGTWLVLERNRAASAIQPGQTPTPITEPGTTFVVYKGHTQQVYTVAWQRQGQFVVSGGKDDKARVWNSSTGKDIYTFIEHSGSVNGLAWSPGGQSIVSASSDTTVRVWQATTGSIDFVYKGHSNNVRTVAWSPDGSMIASGGDDNTVQVWDAMTGAHIFTYKGHHNMIWSVSWSPDSQRLASADVDTTVQVWDATSGGNAFIYHGHKQAVKAVAWSPDGKLIASGSDVPESNVQVWDANTGVRQLTYTEHTGGIYAIAWHPKGQHIASSSWQEVRIWNPVLPAGKTLNTYSDHTGAVHSIAWSPDGQRIASGADDTTVRIWQAV
ncbi:MAG TPA: protein kinase [Ktedonobacteraceae bacterium]|nr:protein kinase [Ktedonobacteraceae bacterium]